MASLFSTAIVAFCTGTVSGQYNEACNKAMDAGTQQAGWRQSVDNVEDKTVNYVNAKVQDKTPKSMQEVVAVAGFGYKTVRDKKLHFKLPTLGLASSISNEITLTSYTINIMWRLP